MVSHLVSTMIAKIDSQQMTPMNIHRTCVLDCCYVGTIDTLEHADREWLTRKGRRQTAKWLRTKPCFALAKIEALEATQTKNAALEEAMLTVPPHAEEEIAQLKADAVRNKAELMTQQHFISMLVERESKRKTAKPSKP